MQKRVLDTTYSIISTFSKLIIVLGIALLFCNSTSVEGQDFHNIDVDATISISFAEPLNRMSVKGNFFLEDPNGKRVDGTAFLSDDGKTLFFKPYDSLEPDVIYSIIIKAGVSTIDGKHLESDTIYTFHTTAADDSGGDKNTSSGGRRAGNAGKTEDKPPETDEEDAEILLTDIRGHWAEEYIKLLVEKGVLSGYEQEDGSYTFLPDAFITRQEFVKIMALALSFELPETPYLPFSDAENIPEWVAPYASALYRVGLVRGRINEDMTVSFDGEANITRAEISTIIGRAIGGASVYEVSFDDKSMIPEWALPHVALGVEKGIISGYEDNTFRPFNMALRAETAKMVSAMLQSES